MVLVRRILVTMAIAPLAWVGAFSVTSAGATTIRQDPTLHRLLLINPHPGWQSAPQAFLEQHYGGLVKALGGRNLAVGDWLAPDGKSQLLIVLKSLPERLPPGPVPSRVKEAFANGVCMPNGGFRSTYGVIAGSRLSTVGMCRHTFEGGAITFATAITQPYQAFLVSVGPGSLSESQLQQVAAKQFQALH
jgi:hypothetical protein